MNKSIVKRMNDLAKAIGRHEEAAEKNFNAKSVGIVKFRVGLEDGTPHSMKDTATYFKVSTAWVGKCTKEIADFCKEMDKEEPKVVPEKEDSDSYESVKVAIMSAVIEDGKIVVKHEDPAVAAKVQRELQAMLEATMPQGKMSAKLALGKRAIDLQDMATTRAIWSFIMFILATVIMLGISVKSESMSDANITGGYALAGVLAFVGLLLYIYGVSLKSVSLGILQAIRKF